MKHDDFFTKVDAKLKKGTAPNAASLETESKNREFIKQIIARLTTVAASYEAMLTKRGINTRVDSSPTGITVSLRYKDGDHNQVYVGGVPNSDLIELNTSYIEGSQTYAATKSYNSSSWQDDFFETRLQGLIDIFLLHADKHGGI